MQLSIESIVVFSTNTIYIYTYIYIYIYIYIHVYVQYTCICLYIYYILSYILLRLVFNCVCVCMCGHRNMRMCSLSALRTLLVFGFHVLTHSRRAVRGLYPSLSLAT